MDSIRIQSFLFAHRTFHELASKSFTADSVVRDASIQRFEYTIDACWKALKVILLKKHGIKASSPKDIMRAAFKENIISNDPLWLKMIDDRNLTSHLYSENMADEVASYFYHYDKLFLELANKINSYEK